MDSDAGKDIEYVRGVVAQRFPVYDTRVTPQAVQFLVTVDPATMEAKFEDLRKELVPKNFIPFLTREGGEHTILVQRRLPQRFVGWHMNLVLLGLTIATTMWAGAASWEGYSKVPWTSPEAIAMGTLTFTLPLMAILGIHEMGHYVMAKRYQVHASLPFFIPAPGTILGTFGAMISIRDPLPNRKALVDIGAAGPILGLLTAIPVTLVGLLLMSVDPRPVPPNLGGSYSIQLPFLYQILALFIPIPQDTVLHPTAFAGWVGLFVTALNLLPAGQLDGGHVARAVLGERSKYLSWAALIAMLALGTLTVFGGWLIIALFILLLGARHPPPLNDLTKLDGKRHGLAAVVLVVVLLSFVAIPMQIIPPEGGVQFEDVNAPGTPVQALTTNVSRGNTTSFSFLVNNTGNVLTNITLSTDSLDIGNARLRVSLGEVRIGNRTVAVNANDTYFILNSSEVARVTMVLNATGYTGGQGQNWTFQVRARIDPDYLEPYDFPQPLRITMRVE
jgi:membrane-associated protease RseP (regulator of RpoE activity)